MKVHTKMLLAVILLVAVGTMHLVALQNIESNDDAVKGAITKQDICIFIDISGSMNSALPAVQKYLTNEVIDKAAVGTRVDIFKFYGKLVSIFGGNINSAETRDYAKQRVNALLANGPWTNLDNIWDYIKAHGINAQNTALYICSDGHEELENGVKEYTLTQDDIGKYIGGAQVVDMGGWFLLEWGVPTEQNIPAIQEAQEVPPLLAVQEEQMPAQEAEERSIQRKLSIVLFVILLVIAIAMFICAIASRRAYEQAMKESIPLEQLNKIEKRCARFIKADVPLAILGIAFFMAGLFYTKVFAVSLALLLCSAALLLCSAALLLLSIALSAVAVLSTIRKSTEIRQTLKNLMKEAEKYDTDASKDLKDEAVQALDGTHKQLVLGIICKKQHEFSERTKLKGKDIIFLFFALGLQVARQFLLTKLPKRLGDQETANKTPGHRKESSDRHNRLYNPSLEEITTNPVPFDAIMGSDGELSGGGKLGHRAKTLGHDPVLGLVFGTANIATSTLTTNEFKSFHIHTGSTSAGQTRDAFDERADTIKVLQKTYYNKLIKEGNEGKIKVTTSLIKEIIHLQSDVDSKNSLPLPIISTIDPKLASKLAEYGLDAGNIKAWNKQFAYAQMIDWLVATVHRLACICEGDELSEVRTGKIVSYSNVIATGVNLAAVGLTQDMKLLDVGGIANTVWELWHNFTIMRRIKIAFVLGDKDKKRMA